jgi:hypothetical protein
VHYKKTDTQIGFNIFLKNNSMDREAILTSMQFPPINRENGPIPFLFNIGGAIGILQGELEWRLFEPDGSDITFTLATTREST